MQRSRKNGPKPICLKSNQHKRSEKTKGLLKYGKNRDEIQKNRFHPDFSYHNGRGCRLIIYFDDFATAPFLVCAPWARSNG